MARRIRTYNISIIEKIKRHFEEVRLYMIACFVTSVIMFSLLFFLTSLSGVHYIISFTIAYLFSVTGNFLFNKSWIFNDFTPKRLHEEYSQFFSASLVAFIINFILIYLFVDFLQVYYLLAQVLISLLIFPLRFTLHKNLVFDFK